jgi:hypothetical protein
VIIVLEEAAAVVPLSTARLFHEYQQRIKMSSPLMSNNQIAEMLGFTRQHFESFKRTRPGFPEPAGTERPKVVRNDGGFHMGSPYPVFKKSDVMKWIKDHDIKRTRNKDLYPTNNQSFDNDLAQRFIRMPRIVA